MVNGQFNPKEVGAVGPPPELVGEAIPLPESPAITASTLIQGATKPMPVAQVRPDPKPQPPKNAAKEFEKEILGVLQIYGYIGHGKTGVIKRASIHLSSSDVPIVEVVFKG